MPMLLGDVCLMFPGTVENHMGMRPLATPAASLHWHLAEGPASGAMQGLRITEIAAQMQGGSRRSIVISL